MANTPRPVSTLRPGETALGVYPATVYKVRDGLSTRGSNVQLTLTNQRVILQSGLAARALPLHAITQVVEQPVMAYTMVHLTFATGHQEWWTVARQPEFLQALHTARASAPVIEEGITPQSLNPALPGFLGVAVVLFVGAFGLTLVGMVACFVLVALIFATR